MNKTVLKVDKLVKDYGSFRAVDQVSFEVRSGEVFGLLGPNGAGKTSVISTIVTLETPTSGSITIKDRDVYQYSQQTKSITGFVPQEVISHGYFTLYEILQFQSGYYGFLRNGKHIDTLIQKLGLWEHRHKNVRQLSGGMKRRLMIAKALVHSPELLLLDEPTAGVDVELRYSIWDQVRELRKKGVGILFTTHYLEEAEQLCDRVAIIHKGKIQSQGITKELIQQLTSRHVTVFLKEEKKDFSHQNLVNHSGRTLEFRIPYSKGIGEFLSELKFNNVDIVDLRIREGTLEDAFKYVLNEDGRQ